MAYERDVWCFGYLLVPSLDMNQLQEHYEMSTGTSPEKCIQSLRGMRMCLRLWFPPEKLHPCACAGALAVMSPCRTSCVCWHVCVCVCVCQARSGICLHNTLHFDGALTSHVQQGSSSCEVLRKNWQEKFACWVYRACTLNVPRGFWQITHRINLIWFFCCQPSVCSMVEWAW